MTDPVDAYLINGDGDIFRPGPFARMQGERQSTLSGIMKDFPKWLRWEVRLVAGQIERNNPVIDAGGRQLRDRSGQVRTSCRLALAIKRV